MPENIPVFHIEINPEKFPQTYSLLLSIITTAGDEARAYCRENDLPDEVAIVVHEALMTESKSKLDMAKKYLREISSEFSDVTHMKQQEDGTVEIFDHWPCKEDAEKIDARKRQAGLN